MDPQQDPLNSPDLGPSLPASHPLDLGGGSAGTGGGGGSNGGWLPPAGPPAAPTPAAPGDWQSSSGTMPAGIGGSPVIPAATPPPTAPLQPHQQKALQAIGEKHGADNLTPDGLINTEMIKNDLSQLAMDDQAKARAMKAVYDANDHVRVMSAIGAQQARDASGADYWQNASTGEKILRVLGGIVTLGGSEAYIGTQIKKKVAQDQKDLEGEDNTYKAMVDAGKTAEQAASIDYSKQAHIYQLGLDRVAAKYPSPVIQARIAAMKTAMQKDTSAALLGFYKQQEDNRVAQQNANSTSMNAQTERAKAVAEQGKAGAPTLLRDSNGKVIGHTDTPDQAKQIQAQQLSVEGLDRLASRVKSYSWTDKFTPSARAAAAADYSQAMQLVNTYRAAHPNEESSRQMEVLGKSIPNPSELTTSPGAYRTGFSELLKQMKLSLVASKKQSGI